MNNGRDHVGPETAAWATLSDEAFETRMADFAKGTASLPPLPADFSRNDLYADHE
jgi:hypothetical protein